MTEQSKSQNSKIFDGKYLKMTKKGMMYKHGEKTSLTRALSKSVGGSKFKTLKEALAYSKTKLGELYG